MLFRLQDYRSEVELKSKRSGIIQVGFKFWPCHVSCEALNKLLNISRSSNSLLICTFSNVIFQGLCGSHSITSSYSLLVVTLSGVLAK